MIWSISRTCKWRLLISMRSFRWCFQHRYSNTPGIAPRRGTRESQGLTMCQRLLKPELPAREGVAGTCPRPACPAPLPAPVRPLGRQEERRGLCWGRSLSRSWGCSQLGALSTPPPPTHKGLLQSWGGLLGGGRGLWCGGCPAGIAPAELCCRKSLPGKTCGANLEASAAGEAAPGSWLWPGFASPGLHCPWERLSHQQSDQKARENLLWGRDEDFPGAASFVEHA